VAAFRNRDPKGKQAGQSAQTSYLHGHVQAQIEHAMADDHQASQGLHITGLLSPLINTGRPGQSRRGRQDDHQRRQLLAEDRPFGVDDYLVTVAMH
jgi:hypothetical protein